MSSNRKQAAWNVKNEIIRHKILIAACMIWCGVSTWGALNNIWNTFEFYGCDSCAADLLIDHQASLYSGLYIFPFVIFCVIKCKQNSLNIQYVVRYGMRKRMLGRLFAESMMYSICTALIIIIVGTTIGFVMTGQFINWDSLNSVYLMRTGYMTSISFIVVAVMIWFMYVVKFMILLSIVDILLWYPKWLFTIWFVILGLLGIESILHQEIFFGFFAVWHADWESPVGIGITAAAGCLVVAAEYLTGTKVINNRDIFN